MENYYFDGQRDGEKVIAVWRRNPWTLTRSALILVLLTWLAIYAFKGFGFIVIALWLIIAPIVAFYGWFIWWNDTYILTNQRLIDIDQRKLFHRLVAEIPLENIQDVIYETRGLNQTIFNFGTIKVQTASGKTVSSMSGITDPLSVQQAILREVSKKKKP